MPDAPSRPILRPRRGPRVAAWLLGVALLVAIGWMVVTVGSPLPTTHIAMATGPAGSGAAAIGLRYREILKRSGVNLRLVETAGGFANVARLKDRATGISVALVGSGVTSRAASPDPVALGSVSLEPLRVMVGRRRGLAGCVTVSLFTANAEYFGGGRLTQAPFFDTQAHVSCAIRGVDFWAAASVGYGWGGRTTVDGVPGDAITNVRVSGVLRYPLARGHSLKLAYINGFRTEVGADCDTIQLVHTHAWGGKR